MRKCSKCGAAMTKTAVGYKCSGCTNVEPLKKNKVSKINKNTYTGTKPDAGAKPNTGTRVNTNTATGEQKNVLLITLLVVFATVMVVAVITFVAVFCVKVFQILSEEPQGGRRTSAKDKVQKEEVVEAEAEGFQSNTMRHIVSIIYGKSADSVTEEELAAIKYIEMSVSWMEDGVIFQYSTEDYHDYLPDTMDKVPDYLDDIPFAYTEQYRSTFKKIQLQMEDEYRDEIYGDIRNFTGVKALSLRDYDKVDLSGLKDLSMIICNGDDISILLEANVNPAQIEALHASGIDLTGIEQFTSLKRLYLCGNEFAQLEKVTACEKLEELYCVRLKGDKSYEVLRNMPKLRNFYIEGSSDGVKDLSPIASLTSLERLSVVDTEIIRADFLKELQNLKVLRLARNGELENMEVLGELTNLEYLELNLDALHGHQPQYESIKNLKNLKKLNLDTVYNLDFLYELENLEELEIDLTFYNYLLEPIRQMKGLKKLSLISCHSQYPDGFACLQELPELKYLKIEDMEFDDPVDGLFALDKLEELHITGCKLYAFPAAVAVGENLQVLNFAGTYFRVMPGYGEYMYVGYEDPGAFQEVLDQYFQAISLKELYLDFCVFDNLSGLRNLTNLEVLSLTRCELTELPVDYVAGCDSLRELNLERNTISDISFVAELPALESINLWDCYVTDLSPLLQCENLQYVNAKNNPVGTNPLTGVEVILE